MATPNRRKFTLIEILVVIAIIAVLAGLLFPATSFVRERGKTAKCLGNCKNWAYAVHLYYQENNEVGPNDGGNGTTVGGIKWPDLNSDSAKTSFWVNVIPPMMKYDPYWKMAESGNIPLPGNGIAPVFTCPSDRGLESGKDPNGYDVPYTDPTTGLKFYFNYIYNVKASGSNNAPPQLGKIANPSRSVMLFERRSGTDYRELPDVDSVLRRVPDAYYDSSLRASFASTTLIAYRGSWSLATGRHLGGCNVSFYDGSARTCHFGELQKVERDSGGSIVYYSGKVNRNSSEIVWSPSRNPIN